MKLLRRLIHDLRGLCRNADNVVDPSHVRIVEQGKHGWGVDGSPIAAGTSLTSPTPSYPTDSHLTDLGSRVIWIKWPGEPWCPALTKLDACTSGPVRI